ncbi:monocarboxylate transporter [Elysia marginata]|uniref:Monocarboxylate transporter n=1 Tax=Elysia marginata TaxID=1093978 RepID=A0AAV4GNX4_9GAST|nr:monocarboxylate transporter [Elysia marginata]
MGNQEVSENENVQRSHEATEELPVDRGWAWLVLLGASVNVMLLMLFLRATSLLFILFLDIYHASSTMTTLVFALSSVTFSTSNIVASTVLIRYFEVRSMCLTGAVVNFFTIIGIAFAPNIIVMNLLFAVLGCAHGLIVVPQLTLLGHYFKKHLSLATATTTMGISLATIGGTPITQMLLNMYGVRGTIVLLAGITLHCVPASMLLRPTSLYRTVPPTTAAVDEDSCEQRSGSESLCNEKNEVKTVIVEEQVNLMEKPDETTLETRSKRRHHKLMKKVPQRRQRSVSESWVVSTKKNTFSYLHSSNLIYENTDHDEGATVDIKSTGITTSISNILSMSLRYLSDTSSVYGSSLTQAPDPFTLLRHSKMDEENYKEVRQVSPEEQVLAKEQQSVSGEINKNIFKTLKESASKSVYTNPVGILLLLASGLGIHTQAGVNYMPATGVENGLTGNQISWLLTVLGVADVISKFAIGVLADTGIISRIKIACLTQFSIGVFFQAVSVFQGFPLMLVLQVLVGLSVGVFHVLLPVITVDLLGVQHMGHIVSGYMLINGIVNALDHLVVGSLRDITGSLYGSYHYMGSLSLMSVAMLLLHPLVVRCSRGNVSASTVDI